MTFPPDGTTRRGAAGGGSGLCGGAATGCTTTNGGGSGNGSAVVTYTQVAADVSITTTDSDDPVLLGETFEYTLTIANAGPVTATNVAVIDALPDEVTYLANGSDPRCFEIGTNEVVCTLETIAVDGSTQVKLRVRADALADPATNLAGVTRAQPDPNSTNNSATEETTIAPAADLGVTMSDSADPVFVGDSFQYTVAVANAGPSVASDILIFDLLPAQVTFDATASDPRCFEDAPGVIFCMVDSIASGSADQVVIAVTANASAHPAVNQASASAVEAEPDFTDNSPTEQTTIDDPPTAVNDVATLTEDSAANAINVLANDTDTDAGPKTIASKTNGSNGTVAITGGGSGLTYTPNANYCNEPGAAPADTFTYTLNGGSTATVT